MDIFIHPSIRPSIHPFIHTLFQTSSSDSDCSLTFSVGLSVPTFETLLSFKSYDMIWHDDEIRYSKGYNINIKTWHTLRWSSSREAAAAAGVFFDFLFFLPCTSPYVGCGWVLSSTWSPSAVFLDDLFFVRRCPPVDSPTYLTSWSVNYSHIHVMLLPSWHLGQYQIILSNVKNIYRRHRMLNNSNWRRRKQSHTCVNNLRRVVT